MQRQPLHSQQGSVLLLSLVLLTVITLTSVIGMQRSTTQIRMLNNMQHQQEMFNATNDHLELGMTFFQDKENYDDVEDLIGPLTYNGLPDKTLPNIKNSLNWTPPTPKRAGIQVEDYIELNSLSDKLLNSPEFAKGNSGASQGAQNVFYFSYIVTSTDASGRLASTQEIVFNLRGAAQ